MLSSLQYAQANKAAVAAFNICSSCRNELSHLQDLLYLLSTDNLEGAKAIVQAAELLRSPIILQVRQSYLDCS